MYNSMDMMSTDFKICLIRDFSDKFQPTIKFNQMSDVHGLSVLVVNTLRTC